jgi:hypothetical protein
VLRLRVRDYAPTDVLGFRSEGVTVRERMFESLTEPNDPAVLAVDFREMRVMASSPLDELTFVLRDNLRRRGSCLFPVFTNLDPWREELEAISAIRRGDSLPLCELDNSGSVHGARILGSLDEAQKVTLRALQKMGEATGALLHQSDADGRRTSATAWNNRLAYLSRKGLVVERAEGRAKFYRPVLADMEV